jgi:hypothetical protein
MLLLCLEYYALDIIISWISYELSFEFIHIIIWSTIIIYMIVSNDQLMIESYDYIITKYTYII